MPYDILSKVLLIGLLIITKTTERIKKFNIVNIMYYITFPFYVIFIKSTYALMGYVNNRLGNSAAAI